MNHNSKPYTMPNEQNDDMAHETIALPYNSMESLKLQCLEKVMQINDNSVLLNIVHMLNSMIDDVRTAQRDYTLEELQQRTDDAFAELEAGGGADGECFFASLKQNGKPS